MKRSERIRRKLLVRITLVALWIALGCAGAAWGWVAELYEDAAGLGATVALMGICVLGFAGSLREVRRLWRLWGEECEWEHRKAVRPREERIFQ